MKILVERKPSHLDATISILSVDNEVIGVTCEDEVRPEGAPKVYGKTAIPAGTYRVIVNKSTRFSAKAGKDVFLPLLLDLPGKVTMFGGKKLDDCGIRIHKGNKPEDTEGCLLVGRIANPDGRTISESKILFDPLFAQIQAALKRQEQVLITITNPAIFA